MEACGVLWFAAAHIHDIDLHEIKHLKLMICVASFDLKQLLVWKFMEILSLVWIHLCVVLISVMIYVLAVRLACLSTNFCFGTF